MNLHAFVLLTAMTSKHVSQTFLIAEFLSCIKSIRYPGASANNIILHNLYSQEESLKIFTTYICYVVLCVFNRF